MADSAVVFDMEYPEDFDGMETEGNCCRRLAGETKAELCPMEAAAANMQRQAVEKFMI
jgi:hypothetical protein